MSQELLLARNNVRGGEAREADSERWPRWTEGRQMDRCVERIIELRSWRCIIRDTESCTWCSRSTSSAFLVQVLQFALESSAPHKPSIAHFLIFEPSNSRLSLRESHPLGPRWSPRQVCEILTLFSSPSTSTSLPLDPLPPPLPIGTALPSGDAFSRPPLRRSLRRRGPKRDLAPWPLGRGSAALLSEPSLLQRGEEKGIIEQHTTLRGIEISNGKSSQGPQSSGEGTRILTLQQDDG